ncbi:hypothetical protein CEXT_29531 [Caerostris extrusa]|uniref:Uncharacterized protein n=1 Tax=Caerostris extrusa TaxID=172846 RepID=A0AAV4XWM8_CAEEX|nr:hypothetical protein CEXT_29531 [Caerostris extrusa]
MAFKRAAPPNLLSNPIVGESLLYKWLLRRKGITAKKLPLRLWREEGSSSVNGFLCVSSGVEERWDFTFREGR